MARPLLLIILTAFCFGTRSQNLDAKVSNAVQTVYNQYKLFFDSSLLNKYVVLDKNKSYLVNSQTQKIKTLALADDSFVFDEFSLSFAIVYKGDTIRHLPACRLDTHENLMALGTPTNPVQHGDVLPPYVELVKGNIKFDYKKLLALLRDLKLDATAVNLQKTPVKADAQQNSKPQYNWVVTTACPDLKCKDVLISAINGKVQAD
jgi:hypothetical protein